MITIATVLAILRVIGVKHIAFQAVAHLFVGGLFVSWNYTRERKTLVTAVALSLVELTCFLVGQYLGH